MTRRGVPWHFSCRLSDTATHHPNPQHACPADKNRTTDPAAANMTRFMGLDLIIYMNWTRGSLWPIMGLTTQTNHQLAVNALNSQGYRMVSSPLPAWAVPTMCVTRLPPCCALLQAVVQSLRIASRQRFTPSPCKPPPGLEALFRWEPDLAGPVSASWALDRPCCTAGLPALAACAFLVPSSRTHPGCSARPADQQDLSLPSLYGIAICGSQCPVAYSSACCTEPHV